ESAQKSEYLPEARPLAASQSHRQIKLRAFAQDHLCPQPAGIGGRQQKNSSAISLLHAVITFADSVRNARQSPVSRASARSRSRWMRRSASSLITFSLRNSMIVWRSTLRASYCSCRSGG